MRRYIQTTNKWGVTKNGELWRKGRHGYMAGYVSRPTATDSFECAIEAAEEESRVLLAQAKEELLSGF